MASPLRLLALAVIIAAGFCQGALAQPTLPTETPIERANAGTAGVISGGHVHIAWGRGGARLGLHF